MNQAELVAMTTMATEVRAVVRELLEKRKQHGWRRGLAESIVGEARRLYPNDERDRCLLALCCGALISMEPFVRVDKVDILRLLGGRAEIDKQRLYFLSLLVITKGLT